MKVGPIQTALLLLFIVTVVLAGSALAQLIRPEEPYAGFNPARLFGNATITSDVNITLDTTNHVDHIILKGQANQLVAQPGQGNRLILTTQPDPGSIMAGYELHVQANPDSHARQSVTDLYNSLTVTTKSGSDQPFQSHQATSRERVQISVIIN